MIYELVANKIIILGLLFTYNDKSCEGNYRSYDCIYVSFNFSFKSHKKKIPKLGRCKFMGICLRKNLGQSNSFKRTTKLIRK